MAILARKGSRQIISVKVKIYQIVQYASLKSVVNRLSLIATISSIKAALRSGASRTRIRRNVLSVGKLQSMLKMNKDRGLSSTNVKEFWQVLRNWNLNTPRILKATSSMKPGVKENSFKC